MQSTVCTHRKYSESLHLNKECGLSVHKSQEKEVASVGGCWENKSWEFCQNRNDKGEYFL